MPAWLDEIVSEDRLLHSGHAACAGCAPAINVRHVLDGLAAARPESKIVLVIPASCWTIIAGVWPVNAFGVTVHLTPFASAAAEASGIKAALRLRGHEDTQVVVWGGDGAHVRHRLLRRLGGRGAKRGHHLRPQRQRGLHEHRRAEVRRHPRGRLDDDDADLRARGTGQKKDIARIMAAHGIPYVATLALGSVPMLKDFRAKVTRAAEVQGFRFLHILGPCPPGWRYPTEQSIEIARLAVESPDVPAPRVRPRRVEDHVPPEAPGAGERVPRSAGTLQPPLRRGDRDDPVPRRRALESPSRVGVTGSERG